MPTLVRINSPYTSSSHSFMRAMVAICRSASCAASRAGRRLSPSSSRRSIEFARVCSTTCTGWETSCLAPQTAPSPLATLTSSTIVWPPRVTRRTVFRSRGRSNGRQALLSPSDFVSSTRSTESSAFARVATCLSNVIMASTRNSLLVPLRREISTSHPCLIINMR